MKASTFKGMFAAFAAVALAVLPFVGRGVTIDVTKVRQRYPWNGLVDIDYTITRTAGEVELNASQHSVEITVLNCDDSVAHVARMFRQGWLPLTDGSHRVTWDANAEGVDFNARSAKVSAAIVHYSAKYMVIDVSKGSAATVYPVTYLDGAPQDGFVNDTYRGDKIALRLIPPGSYVMGSPTTEPGHNTLKKETEHAVAITKPFYIGVFHITQKQYENVTGAANVYYSGPFRPMEKVSYNAIRGTADLSTYAYDWPHNSDVAENSFMGLLRAKCREWDDITQDWTAPVSGFLDLPTEAQWEYACRAGTSTPYNNGSNCVNTAALDAQITKLGRYNLNQTDEKGGYPLNHTVEGCYEPNAWGLYDMHGNAWEWCLDWHEDDLLNLENPSVDPVGPKTGQHRTVRGGGWSNVAAQERSAVRSADLPNTANQYLGFRLARHLP